MAALGRRKAGGATSGAAKKRKWQEELSDDSGEEKVTAEEMAEFSKGVREEERCEDEERRQIEKQEQEDRRKKLEAEAAEKKKREEEDIALMKEAEEARKRELEEAERQRKASEDEALRIQTSRDTVLSPAMGGLYHPALLAANSRLRAQPGFPDLGLARPSIVHTIARMQAAAAQAHGLIPAGSLATALSSPGLVGTPTPRGVNLQPTTMAAQPAPRPVMTTVAPVPRPIGQPMPQQQMVQQQTGLGYGNVAQASSPPFDQDRKAERARRRQFGQGDPEDPNCWTFKSKGYCRNGDNCKYIHQGQDMQPGTAAMQPPGLGAGQGSLAEQTAVDSASFLAFASVGAPHQLPTGI